jgi:hypothetical protein
MNLLLAVTALRHGQGFVPLLLSQALVAVYSPHVVVNPTVLGVAEVVLPAMTLLCYEALQPLL